MRELGKACTFRFYDGARHGFAVRTHPGYAEDAARHVRNGRPLVLRTMQDEHGDVHALGEVVRLGARLSARRPEGKAV